MGDAAAAIATVFSIFLIIVFLHIAACVSQIRRDTAAVLAELRQIRQPRSSAAPQVGTFCTLCGQRISATPLETSEKGR